ncbi:MAG: hypothetical protein FWF69_00555, partial [Firmicutes bacterium]|nr:hypothetical protein [Bacillota bacterium]
RVSAQTLQALSGQDGLKGLAGAMAGGSGERMQEAMSEFAQKLENAEAAKGLADALSQAAAVLDEGAVKDGLMASAGALRAGDASQAMRSLSGALDSTGAAGADISSLLRMARGGVASAGTRAGTGQGQGSGSSQQAQGQGAGMGTTNQDAGYSPGLSRPSQGQGMGSLQDRVGLYERIYDPTRLGGDSEASFVQGQKGEGESQQMRLGPGAGDYAGSVPYGRVIGEYRQAASQAMRRQALPPALQDWVMRYFTALVEE